MRRRICLVLAVIAQVLMIAGAGCRGGSAAKSAPAPITFRDVAGSAGIDFLRSNGATGRKWLPETMGGGGGFIDYDADGWLDLVLIDGGAWPGASTSAGHRTIRLYHNNRNGTFTDVTEQSGLVGDFQGMGVAVGDFDNDGYDDLLVTGVGGSRLFRNVPDQKGGRKFVDVTSSSGIRDQGWPTSAAWIDYDNDGRLDLFICHYLAWTPATDRACGASFKAYCGPQEYQGESCRLYHNEGAGRFKDVTKSAGIVNPHSKALGVCVCDLDRDGWPDIVVANDTEPNSVYHNLHGRFEEIGIRTGIGFSLEATARAGMGIDSADYRRDSSLGFIIGNFSQEGLSLYDLPAKSSEMLATERSRASGLFDASYRCLTFGLLFADFDNDTFPDVIAANGHVESDISRIHPGETFAQPCLVFRNLGQGVFGDVTGQAGAAVSAPMVGRAVARGDYDNDGRIDVLVVGNSGRARLLHNETRNGNHWIAFHLVGSRSNRNGYGAWVTVTAGGCTQTQYCASGSSYLAAHDPRAHFGLPAGTADAGVEIAWPDGTMESAKITKVDQIVTIRQAAGASKTGQK